MEQSFFRRSILVLTAIISSVTVAAQLGPWTGTLYRNDNNPIPFNFEQKTEKGKTYWIIKNAAERITVNNIHYEGDSMILQMPVFESKFIVKKEGGKFSGSWIKGGALKSTTLSFVATPGNKRFEQKKKAMYNITGRWAVNFSGNKKGEISVGEFVQKGNILTGTFLNSTGDYRYLQGIVSADSLFLSGFDGGHAFLFTAKIESSKRIMGGTFYSGASYKETWSALKDARAKVPLENVAMYVKPGEDRLHFRFKNLEGNPVSIDDEKFLNKVVVIQLMGSWCPNCMDETAFLSEYYNNNKQRGVEVIALGYEYSTDWERSVKSLKKFQQRYNVQYTILNTGVTVTDSLRTEKTLPEVTPIKFFPSSIILDKKGKIRKLDTGFNGPATGEHYLAYKKEFEETVDQLLKEE